VARKRSVVSDEILAALGNIVSADDVHSRLLAKAFLVTKDNGRREMVVDMRDVLDELFPGSAYERDDDEGTERVPS
jgi:hypothetical protein